jgi:hypothetical protein
MFPYCSNRRVSARQPRDRRQAEPSSWATLVPELLVTDLNKTLFFWRDVCGLTVLFDRPDEGFAYTRRHRDEQKVPAWGWGYRLSARPVGVSTSCPGRKF